MPKPKNPRRAALEVLRSISANVRQMISEWTVAGTLYDHDAPRAHNGNVIRRKRRADEYPENSAAQWDRLVRYAEAMEAQARSVRVFAEQQRRACDPLS